MTAATKSKQSTAKTTAPRNTNAFGSVKIAAPIYVGVTNELAKDILEALREKCGEHENRTLPHSSVSVETFGITQQQSAMEARLRIDLKTLRGVLFDSWSRGLNLDLALRLQDEVKDTLQFLDRSVVEQGVAASLDHYAYFATSK